MGVHSYMYVSVFIHSTNQIILSSNKGYRQFDTSCKLFFKAHYASIGKQVVYLIDWMAQLVIIIILELN